MAQGLSEVLDTGIDTSKMDFRQLELDKTKNQAMYPVFQQTFLTNPTKAIVLKQEATSCTSRETWGRLELYFKKSIHHQNTKSEMKQKIINHKAHLWKNLMTSFIYRFNELITNYNDVADTTEIIEEDEMKEMLRKAILGHPDLLNVEISDKAYQRVHGRKMDYLPMLPLVLLSKLGLT